MRLGRWESLVSNGRDGFGTDSREIDCIVAFFINLADEDAEREKKKRDIISPGMAKDRDGNDGRL